MAKVEKRGVRLEFRAVGDKALKNISRNMSRLTKNSRSLRRNFSGLRNVFLGVFAARGVRSVVRMADTIQLLGDRINAFTGSAEAGGVALNLLFDAANRTNQSIDVLAEGFNRVALASSDLGLSTEDLIAFTTTLQNAFRIQGASAAEARGATIQLTQGLSSGALRGQELRSVLEASAVAADVLAEAVGVGRGELIKFAETGGFTSEVVLKAFSRRALELDERAAKLGTTFGQTLTKATNELKRGINELNQDLELNKAFEESILGITENIKELIKTIAQSEGFKDFLKDTRTFSDEIVDTFKRLTGTQTELDKIEDSIFNVESALKRAKKTFTDAQDSETSSSFFESFLKSIRPGGVGTDDTLAKRIFGGDKQLERIKTLEKSLENLQKQRRKLLGITKDQNKENENAPPDPIERLLKNFSQRDFDALVSKGAITIQKLNLLYSQGAISVNQYRSSLAELSKLDIGKQFTEGKITADEFNKEISELNDRIGLLSEKLGPVEVGARRYIQSIKSVAEETAGAVENAFGTLENQLLTFVQTGKFLFEDFANAVLNDINRIIIRTQIIKPLIQSLGVGEFNTAGADFDPANARGSAKGNIFNNGDVQAFANGGVVNSPTFFPMRSGTGLMGEAGPEAIVPLERVSGGDLGVKAIPGQTIINVNNKTNSEIDIQEQEDANGAKVLDITITRAVNRAINQGRLDKSLSTSFGLNRKGSR